MSVKARPSSGLELKLFDCSLLQVQLHGEKGW